MYRKPTQRDHNSLKIEKTKRAQTHTPVSDKVTVSLTLTLTLTLTLGMQDQTQLPHCCFNKLTCWFSLASFYSSANELADRKPLIINTWARASEEEQSHFAPRQWYEWMSHEVESLPLGGVIG